MEIAYTNAHGLRITLLYWQRHRAMGLQLFLIYVQEVAQGTHGPFPQCRWEEKCYHSIGINTDL